MKSVMKHQFSQAPQARIPRSSFNRTHGYKTTFDAGYLVPIFTDEVLPGDTFNLKASLLARLATPIVPFMDNMFLETFFFFVPNRLLWDNWQAFNGEQKNPGDTTDYLVPTVTAPISGWEYGSLSDYFGIPTRVPSLETISLYHRAYNLIWNEWFRSQDLQDSVPVNTGDGPDDPDDYTLLRRTKRHDYFTSCLPWPQKGPGVELPLGSTAPVSIDNFGNLTVSGPSGATLGTWASTYSATSNDPSTITQSGFSVGFSSPLGELAADHVAGTGEPFIRPYLPAGLFSSTVTGTATGTVSLADATAASINSLRQAFQIQKLLERDARGGTRYTEILRSHFGVISPDSRLQRPEYLGGSSTPIYINQVAQTSSSDGSTPQGNLAAYGITTDHFHGFTKSFVEHGVIIGLVNVRADLTYQQGLDRRFSRQTRYDYYWPAFAHLGEQAVLNKEIFATGYPVDDDAVFGYNERWAEYRYAPSRITGKLRSTDPQSLDIWHLSQKFASPPALNAEFIEDNPPIERVVAVTTEPQFIFDSYFRLRCVRPMPLYSIPGLIDHF